MQYHLIGNKGRVKCSLPKFQESPSTPPRVGQVWTTWDRVEFDYELGDQHDVENNKLDEFINNEHQRIIRHAASINHYTLNGGIDCDMRLQGCFSESKMTEQIYHSTWQRTAKCTAAI